MCWKCNNPLLFSIPISRSETCSSCGYDVRSCKNCSFYNLGSHYDCHETIDEQVLDKERANFCDYFKLSIQESSKLEIPPADSKAQFNSLFGD